jgi:hypothetical protein
MALQTDPSGRPLLIDDHTSEFHLLELQLRELTKIAWTTEESFLQPLFFAELKRFCPYFFRWMRRDG